MHCLRHLTEISKLICTLFTKASENIAEYANHSHCGIQFTVGFFVWLSLEHLSLPSLLIHKFAAKFFGPYEVT